MHRVWAAATSAVLLLCVACSPATPQTVVGPSAPRISIRVETLGGKAVTPADAPDASVTRISVQDPRHGGSHADLPAFFRAANSAAALTGTIPNPAREAVRRLLRDITVEGAAGTVWTPTTVLVVTRPVTDPGEYSVVPWPGPVPPARSTLGTQSGDYTCREVALAALGLIATRGSPPDAKAPAVRIDGVVNEAYFRPLLPGEAGCSAPGYTH